MSYILVRYRYFGIIFLNTKYYLILNYFKSLYQIPNTVYQNFRFRHSNSVFIILCTTLLTGYRCGVLILRLCTIFVHIQVRLFVPDDRVDLSCCLETSIYTCSTSVGLGVTFPILLPVVFLSENDEFYILVYMTQFHRFWGVY